MQLNRLYGMPPHFGLYISYYTASFCHGYMGAGPTYGIRPYQPAGALDNPGYAEKKQTKLKKKMPKIMKKCDNLHQGMDTITNYVAK